MWKKPISYIDERLYDNGGLVPVLELRFGVDQLTMDDSHFKLGNHERDKEFINLKSRRFLDDFKSLSSNGVNDPMFALHISLQDEGTHYSRETYGFLNWMEDVGGFTESLRFIWLFLVLFFCAVR